MGIEILIPLLAVFSIFFIPITGLMFILTSRFALKPLVETLAKALRESGQGASPDLLAQLQDISEKVESMGSEIERLRDAHEFDRKLLEAKSEQVGIQS